MKKHNPSNSEVARRRIVRIGGSTFISLPPKWLRAHGIDPEKLESLLTIANSDIRIVNPDNEGEIHTGVSEFVKEGDYEKQSRRKKK